MASALFLSEDQFLCSICLDVFTEPVTIPCGHNFCKPCITKHWGDKNHCYCPLCNEKFNKGLKLCVNVSFREVVENFKKHRVISENGIEVKPGEVPCDFCLGKKFKAYKTCLECLASFCKRHLEPHQVVSAFSRHQLTDPAHNQKDKICKKHNRISDLFCKKDLTRVCVLCTEHKAHDTVPLEKEYNETKAQLEQKKLEVKAMIKERQKKAQEIKDLVDTKRKEKDEALANSAHAFSTLVAPIQRIPQKFNRYAYVLGKKGFSEGRFYYEVQAARKTGWDLGVVRGSMRWKKTHTLNPGNGVWILRLRNNTKYTALNHAAVKIPVARKAERVGVFVDYKKRSVSFYDVSTATLIHSFTGCAFNETIYPFFSPGPPEDGLNCAPLVLSPTKHSTEKLNEFFSLIAVVIALVLFWIF
uniref:Uncharacterized protein n=1 Tax=Echeneis naucrates TaxID=173247 RepID=A0A665SWK8_ECHNA